MTKSDMENPRRNLHLLYQSVIFLLKLDQSDYDFVEHISLGVYERSPGNTINNLQCKATCKSINSTPMDHISPVSNNVHENLEQHVMASVSESDIEYTSSGSFDLTPELSMNVTIII